MVVKKLSREIQSLFSSNFYITTYRRIVEELVFNSLDSKATSIAIRIHIQENKLQVVDNGCGILKDNFNLLGQRYATSKLTDLSCLKSITNTYGFRGHALASMVDVSRTVKITSKAKNTDEAWFKSFYKGKEQLLMETTRPSKGTTVEINGFLYNLHIQNNTVNILNELQEIKAFLEGISLIYSHISLSLRDDSRNEIVFKVHKNRDIYQTFKSIFNIEKTDVQELKVEKGQYKAVAYIGKNTDHTNQCHWIFLNNKIVSNIKLNKIVTDCFTKSKRNRSYKIKFKNYDNKDDLSKNDIPFYFLFLSCPFYDYDISYTPKKSALEFKNWDQIKQLIEKLVKFYLGDVNLNNRHSNKNINKIVDTVEDSKTREQVKQIMNKILGSNSKKLGVSQLQNGIKGKMVKRKKKKKKVDILLSFVPPIGNCDVALEKPNNINIIAQDNKENKIVPNNLCSNQKYNDKPKKSTVAINTPKQKKPVNKIKKDPLITRFEKAPDLVKNRCKILAQEVENFFNHNKKRKRKVMFNEKFDYSSIIKDNKKICVHKRVEEILIHDYIPRQFDKNCRATIATVEKNNYRSSYDLVKTIQKTHNNYQYCSDLSNACKSTHDIISKQNDHTEPQLTYQSHHYNKDENNYEDNFHLRYQSANSKKTKRNHFISKQSKENFAVPALGKSTQKFISKKFKYEFKNNTKTNINHKKKLRSKLFNITKKFGSESFPTIEFNDSENNINLPNKKDVLSYNQNRPIENTYSIDSTNMAFTYTVTSEIIHHEFENRQTSTNYNHYENRTESSITYHNIVKDPNPMNVIFVSNENISIDASLPGIEPLNVCETVLTNEETYNMDIELSNNCEKINDSLFNDASMDFVKNNPNVSDTELNDHKKEKSLQQHTMALKYQNIPDVSEEVDSSKYLGFNKSLQSSENVVEDDIMESNYFTKNIKSNNTLDEIACRPKVHNFKLNDRLRFLPKGLSPIFQNCQSKNNYCEYNLEDEYFKDELYNNFINNVQVQSEAYEVNIQSTKNISGKDIAKLNARLDKDNASLTFNVQSLKKAKVLGQVDNKFIATIVLSKSSNYLVLFDQHAVHERIKLEGNLSDYYNGSVWKSIQLDDVILKLSKDEIIYLHNYKNKFTYFGLQWTILNNSEVVVHAIPEAILGKNPRQVDKVIKAIKNLISEEILIIKSQRGCVSIYPKSIMDLVFSEACRYAIKFGDKLSKDHCEDLLRSLSMCKTPFQCAHGRPVMAVIMEVDTEQRKYEVDVTKLRKFQL